MHSQSPTGPTMHTTLRDAKQQELQHIFTPPRAPQSLSQRGSGVALSSCSCATLPGAAEEALDAASQSAGAAAAAAVLTASHRAAYRSLRHVLLRGQTWEAGDRSAEATASATASSYMALATARKEVHAAFAESATHLEVLMSQLSEAEEENARLRMAEVRLHEKLDGAAAELRVAQTAVGELSSELRNEETSCALHSASAASVDAALFEEQEASAALRQALCAKTKEAADLAVDLDALRTRRTAPPDYVDQWQLQPPHSGSASAPGGNRTGVVSGEQGGSTSAVMLERLSQLGGEGLVGATDRTECTNSPDAIAMPYAALDQDQDVLNNHGSGNDDLVEGEQNSCPYASTDTSEPRGHSMIAAAGLQQQLLHREELAAKLQRERDELQSRLDCMCRVFSDELKEAERQTADVPICIRTRASLQADSHASLEVSEFSRFPGVHHAGAHGDTTGDCGLPCAEAVAHASVGSPVLVENAAASQQQSLCLGSDVALHGPKAATEPIPELQGLSKLTEEFMQTDEQVTVPASAAAEDASWRRRQGLVESIGEPRGILSSTTGSPTRGLDGAMQPHEPFALVFEEHDAEVDLALRMGEDEESAQAAAGTGVLMEDERAELRELREVCEELRQKDEQQAAHMDSMAGERSRLMQQLEVLRREVNTQETACSAAWSSGKASACDALRAREADAVATARAAIGEAEALRWDLQVLHDEFRLTEIEGSSAAQIVDQAQSQPTLAEGLPLPPLSAELQSSEAEVGATASEAAARHSSAAQLSMSELQRELQLVRDELAVAQHQSLEHVRVVTASRDKELQELRQDLEQQSLIASQGLEELQELRSECDSLRVKEASLVDRLAAMQDQLATAEEARRSTQQQLDETVHAYAERHEAATRRIQEERAAMCSERKLVEERRNEVDESLQALGLRETELEARRNEVDESLQAVALRETELEARWTNFEASQEEVSATLQRLEERSRELDSARAEAASVQRQLEARVTELATEQALRAAEIANRGHEALRSSVASKPATGEEAVQKLKRELASARDEIDALQFVQVQLRAQLEEVLEREASADAKCTDGVAQINEKASSPPAPTLDSKAAPAQHPEQALSTSSSQTDISPPETDIETRLCEVEKALAGAEASLKEQAQQLCVAQSIRSALETEKVELAASRSQLRQQLAQLQAEHAKAEARNMIYLARHKSNGGKVYGAQQPPPTARSASAQASGAETPTTRGSSRFPSASASPVHRSQEGKRPSVSGGLTANWSSDSLSSHRSSAG